MKSVKSYILCIKQKKLLKNYALFMNSKNSKSSDPHRPLHKKIKSHTKTIALRYQLQHRIKI